MPELPEGLELTIPTIPATGRGEGTIQPEDLAGHPQKVAQEVLIARVRTDAALAPWMPPAPPEETKPHVVFSSGARAGRERMSWDVYGLHLAQAVSARADCLRRQVGAVIMDPEHRVISTGYNGYPPGKPGCASDGACPRGQRTNDEVAPDSDYTKGDGKCDAFHAEENAVVYARRDLRGCTIYITHSPCPNCQRFLRGSGLIRAVYVNAEGAMAAMSLT